MTDAEFIEANYASFIDNVLLNQTPEFWSSISSDSDDDPSWLVDVLQSSMEAWRKRLERCAGDIMEVCPEGDCPPCHKEQDPHHTEEWWGAIDLDQAYQEDFK